MKTISKRVHRDGTVFEKVWNCRKLFEYMCNVSKASLLTVLETILNCMENFENNVSTACILTSDDTCS